MVNPLFGTVQPGKVEPHRAAFGVHRIAVRGGTNAALLAAMKNHFDPMRPVRIQSIFDRDATLALVSPFSVATGLLAVALCALHGTAYLGLRTQGEHQERCRRAAIAIWCIFLLLVLVVTALAIGRVPAATRNISEAPWLLVVAVLGGASTLWVLRCLLVRKPIAAFAGTCMKPRFSPVLTW